MSASAAVSSNGRTSGFGSEDAGSSPAAATTGGPRCVRVGCIGRVQRDFGLQRPGHRGLRLVAGVRWRWFCSMKCAARQRLEDGGYHHVRKAGNANRIKQEHRIARRLLAACEPFRDERGKVHPRDMVRVMMGELRKQYQRQYRTRWAEDVGRDLLAKP